MRIRHVLAAAAAALAVTTVAAVGQTRVGIAAEPYPPFSSPDASGTWVGWEIEMIEAVCAAAALECEIVPVAWDGIIPALTGGRLDMIMNSMSITADRMQVIDFTDKYYDTPTVIMAEQATEMDASPESLAGKILGVQVATVHEAYAQKHFSDAAEIRIYQTQDEANQDLVAGRIDATQADSIALEAFLESDAGGCCEIKGAVAPDEEVLGLGVGIGVRKGEDTLRAALNAAIATIISDGTYDEITERYFATSIYGG